MSDASNGENAFRFELLPVLSVDSSDNIGLLLSQKWSVESVLFSDHRTQVEVSFFEFFLPFSDIINKLLLLLHQQLRVILIVVEVDLRLIPSHSAVTEELFSSTGEVASSSEK